MDPNKVRTVHGRGGELLKFNGFTVEPILGRHGEPPPNVVDAFQRALKETTAPPTKDQLAELAAIRARGTSDKRVIHFRVGARRDVRTVRVGRDLLLEVDSQSRVAGLWLLNVPPSPST